MTENSPAEKRNIEIESGNTQIRAVFVKPEKAVGLIIFAHGSGSDRLDPRNHFIARKLEEAGFATLLTDLLTSEEGVDRANVFNIGLLAARLKDATLWALKNPETIDLPIGYFGTSTGAAAALITAAELPEFAVAVVAHGGRPDLVMEHLPKVQSPTLLIVGGEDESVLPLNKAALERIRAEKELVIVWGENRSSGEADGLEDAARLAANWFAKYLKK